MLSYFAKDGSFGDADGILIIDTSEWSDEDWENVSEVTDEARATAAVVAASAHAIEKVIEKGWLS